MKHIGSIIFSLALLFLVGCADEIGPFDPGDPGPAPVFTMNAVIDGDTLYMAAGYDGYRMTTNRTTDTNFAGGSIFTGELHDPACPGCDPELRVTLVHRPGTAAGNTVDSAFASGAVVMNPPDPVQPNTRTIAFEYLGQNGPGNPPAVFWDFGDGTFGQGEYVEHTYQLSPIQPNIVLVSCTVNGPGCSSSQINFVNLSAPQFFDVDVSPTGAFTAVEVDIHPVVNNGGAIVVDMGDGSPPRTEWSFIHNYNQPGIYLMSVQYFGIDSTDFFLFERPIVIGSGGPCIAPFEYSDISSPPQPIPVREAQIQYRDGSGNLYTSAPLFGGIEQQLQITNHTPYKENEHGDMVYVVEMETDCWLYEVGGSDSIRMQNAVLQWGLPY